MKKVPHLNIWHDKVGTSYHMHWMVKSKLPNDHPTPNRKSLPPVPNSKSERSETARVLIGARTYHPPRAIEQWLRPRSITKIVPKKIGKVSVFSLSASSNYCNTKTLAVQHPLMTNDYGAQLDVCSTRCAGMLSVPLGKTDTSVSSQTARPDGDISDPSMETLGCADPTP